MSGQSDIEPSTGGVQCLDNKCPKTWSVGARFPFKNAKSSQACKLSYKLYDESTESFLSSRVNGKRKG